MVGLWHHKIGLNTHNHAAMKTAGAKKLSK